jgi:hypothetical protein|tara:strand:- start:484 stop:615 length:132 start_codon:yes stop_codon:yes gene_type:complete
VVVVLGCLLLRNQQILEQQQLLHSQGLQQLIPHIVVVDLVPHH